jgi:hypothetical protein
VAARGADSARHPIKTAAPPTRRNALTHSPRRLGRMPRANAAAPEALDMAGAAGAARGSGV